MPRAYCSICFDTKDVKLMSAINECGHVFCTSCLQHLLQTNRQGRTKPTCPSCRTVIKQKEKDFVGLFLDPPLENTQRQGQDVDNAISLLDDDEGGGSRYPITVLQQARHVSTNLRKLDSSSPKQSVQRAAKEIKKIGEGIPEDESDFIRTLLLEIPGFIDRIISHQYSRLAKTAKEMEEIRERLDDSEELRVTAEAESFEARSALDRAISAAEQTKQRWEAAQVDNQSLRAKHREMEEKIKRLEKEKLELRREISEKEQRNETQQKKIKKLLSERNDLEEQLASSNQQLDNASRQTQILESQLEHAHETWMPSSSMGTTDMDSEFSDFNSTDPVDLDDDADEEDNEAYSHDIPKARPRFSSGWNLENPQEKHKRKRPLDEGPDPNARLLTKTLALDGNNRPKGALHLGDRRKIKFVS
ncbi:hypothetical protein ABKN59_002030 [Abortiporus biennis]